MKKPIFTYADFMKSDHENRLVLVCLGTFKDLNGMNLIFTAMMQMIKEIEMT